MHPTCLKSLNLVTVTVLLWVASPLRIAAVSLNSATSTQTQATQERKAEPAPLYQEGVQPQNSNQNQLLNSKIDNLISLGAEHLSLHQSSQAQKVFEEAVAVSQSILFSGHPDIRAERNTLIKIGEVYLGVGQSLQAKAFFERAIAVFQSRAELPSCDPNPSNYQSNYQSCFPGVRIFPINFYRVGFGRTLNNIGLVYRRQGRYSQALDFYQQALAMLRKFGDKKGEGTTLHNMGFLHYKSGKYPQALNFYQQALAISRDKDFLIAIAQVYDSLDQRDKAQEFYRQAALLPDKVPQALLITPAPSGEVSILLDEDEVEPPEPAPIGEESILLDEDEAEPPPAPVVQPNNKG